MAFDINPKWIIGGAIIVPIAYVYFEMKFSILILAGIGVAGLYFLAEKVIDRAEAGRKEPPNLGPRENYLPEHKTYGIAPDGTPLPPRYEPPTGPQYPQYNRR